MFEIFAPTDLLFALTFIFTGSPFFMVFLKKISITSLSVFYSMLVCVAVSIYVLSYPLILAICGFLVAVVV